jgi:putative ABC transport system permease protein
MSQLAPAKLRPGDAIRVGGHGLRTRPLRVVLSALGIAIGIGAMVAVVGLTSSSQAELNRLLAQIGTNLLTVEPGQTLGGQDAQLPKESVAMIGRIGPVEEVSATGVVSDVFVYRNDRIPEEESNAIALRAATLNLPQTVSATIASGAWLNEATEEVPGVVLGRTAASRLGLYEAGPDVTVWIGGEWFNVVGILDPVALAPELDSAALIGWPVAEDQLGFDGYPTTVYERSPDSAVEAVQEVLPATANPEHPEEVDVSRPSDALAAKAAADETLTTMLLGLGGVALLVGGVGVANTMVISVLERRNEIGLRRSMGATKSHIAVQFLSEALLLSGIGGAAGVVLGLAVTAGYAMSQGWPTVVPMWAMAGGIGATLVIGAIAGLYPAIRAARLSPTTALATI